MLAFDFGNVFLHHGEGAVRWAYEFTSQAIDAFAIGQRQFQYIAHLQGNGNNATARQVDLAIVISQTDGRAQQFLFVDDGDAATADIVQRGGDVGGDAFLGVSTMQDTGAVSGVGTR